MPELPEVEAARLLIEENLVGHTITAVRAEADEKIFGNPAGLAPALLDRTVTAACRHGKNLWLELSGPGPALTLHFGMTGSLAVRGAPRVQYVSARPAGDSAWPPPFTKLEVELDGGSIAAAYADPRRFGKVRLAADPRAGLPTGRDVLLQPFTPADLGDALARAGAKKLKVVLMDQAVAAGVGNWVADEVLWQARLHPEAAASSLSPAQVSALAAALESVPRHAAAVRANDALYPADWIFHVRWGKASSSKPAPKVGGVHAIQWIDVGGRTTAFVPGLQKKGEGGASGKAGGAAKREAAPPPPGLVAKRAKAAAKAEAPPPAAGKKGKATQPRGGGGGGGGGRGRPPAGTRTRAAKGV